MYERFNNYSSSRPRLRKTIGWSLVVVGFVAVIMPVIPGVPLVFVGAQLLGLNFILTDKVKRGFSKRKRIDIDTLPSLDAVIPQETRS